MDRPTLDYRNPRDASRQGRVEQLIRERETVLGMKLFAMAVIGPVVSLAAPAAVAGLVILVDQRWDLRWGFSFLPVFCVCALVLVPVLFFLEWRTRGEFFLDTARDWGLGDNVNDLGMIQTSSHGEWELQTAAATWAAYVEIFLLGPRITLNCVREIRIRRNLGPLDERRAADVVAALLDHDSGINPRTLLRLNETPDDLRPTLLLLVLLNIIDVSKDGQRVWILTEARRALGKR